MMQPQGLLECIVPGLDVIVGPREPFGDPFVAAPEVMREKGWPTRAAPSDAGAHVRPLEVIEHLVEAVVC